MDITLYQLMVQTNILLKRFTVKIIVKKHRYGEVSYYHQMLGASLVPPNKKVVIPLAPERIVKGDGATQRMIVSVMPLNVY